MAALDQITHWSPSGDRETWFPTTLPRLGKHEDFLEERLAENPELLGISSRRTGIHGPYAVFRQLPLRTPSEREIYPDIVLLTASGHLVVVEVKLGTNTELRNRAVIAQIVDYASSFASLDDSQLVAIFNEGSDQPVDNWHVLVEREFPDDSNVEDLSRTLRGRIVSGEISLVIACDHIPPGVEDMVRSVSSQAGLAFDLDLVEVRPFVTEETESAEILFAPTSRLTTEIVSRTSVTVTYRQGDEQPSARVEIVQPDPDVPEGHSWTPEEVEGAFAAQEGPTALEILQFAKEHSAGGVFTPRARRKYANFCFFVSGRTTDGRSTTRVLFNATCGWEGGMFYLDTVFEFAGPEAREALRSRLATVFDLSIKDDTKEVSLQWDSITGKTDQFKELVLTFVDQVNSGD
jgi:hypothetical protein